MRIGTPLAFCLMACPRKRASSIPGSSGYWVPAYAGTTLICVACSRRLGARAFLRRGDRAGGLDLGDLAVAIAELLAQDLLGVLAKERRALHLGDRVRHLHWIAHGQILAARGVIDLDHGAGLAQRRLLGDLLHRQDRAERNIDGVADVHDLELGLGHGPLLDGVEDMPQPRQARGRRGIVRIGLPFRLADEVADRAPHRRLGDEIDVGVGILLPALALEDPAGLAAAGIIARARHRLAERDPLAVLAVLRERAVLQALLVAQLDAGEIAHAVLHGGEHALAASGAHALVERADDAEGEMQAGAGIADLRTGDERRAFTKAGRGGGAAGALRDVLVDLAILVGAGAEALDRGHDHARVGLVDVLPGETHAVERTRREILHQHVAVLDQPLEDLLALGMLGVDGDRALVAVEHGEIEAVGPLHVAQLAAGDVADAGPLDLDHVGAQVGEELRAGRTRLHVGEIEDAHAIERLAGLAPRLGRGLGQAVRNGPLHRRCFRLQLDDLLRRRPGFGLGLGLGFHLLALGHCRFPLGVQSVWKIYFLRIALCGLSLPMLPLSLPAAGSITALTRVGLPESMASFTARISSSGVVTRTPTPPNASISFS